MKTVQKIFTALFMIAPFYGAMADCNIMDMLSKYCDNEGYYEDDKFIKPSDGMMNTDCKGGKIGFFCYKFKSSNHDNLKKDLANCCDKPESEITYTIQSIQRPDTHVKKTKRDEKKEEAEKNCKKENFTGAETVNWTGTKCEITACKEPQFKLSKNKCVSTDGDKCDSKDENATSAKMKDGQCMPICKCGYKNDQGTCVKNTDPAEECTPKDKNAATGEYSCDANDKKYCKIVTCKDDYTPDEKSNKCVKSQSQKGKSESTTNTTTPTQQDCTVAKVGNGAAEVEWVSDKCNIVKCNTETHDEKPVNGKCVSKAYKTASQKLSELLKQAQAALEKIKESNNQTSES